MICSPLSLRPTAKLSSVFVSKLYIYTSQLYARYEIFELEIEIVSRKSIVSLWYLLFSAEALDCCMFHPQDWLFKAVEMHAIIFPSSVAMNVCVA